MHEDTSINILDLQAQFILSTQIERNGVVEVKRSNTYASNMRQTQLDKRTASLVDTDQMQFIIGEGHRIRDQRDQSYQSSQPLRLQRIVTLTERRATKTLSTSSRSSDTP